MYIKTTTHEPDPHSVSFQRKDPNEMLLNSTKNLQTTMPLSPIVAQWHQHVIEPPANYLAEYNKALVPEPVQPRQHIAAHTLSIKADSAHSDHNSDVRKIASIKMKFL